MARKKPPTGGLLSYWRWFLVLQFVVVKLRLVLLGNQEIFTFHV